MAKHERLMEALLNQIPKNGGLLFTEKALPWEGKQVYPKNPDGLELEEFYREIECETIEVVQLFDQLEGYILVIDEEGRLKNKPENIGATEMFRVGRNTGENIVGRAILMKGDEFR